jgi:hypothetical protein
MKKIKDKIAELEKKISGISYKEYKKLHPKTKKTPSDSMFAPAKKQAPAKVPQKTQAPAKAQKKQAPKAPKKQYLEGQDGEVLDYLDKFKSPNEIHNDEWTALDRQRENARYEALNPDIDEDGKPMKDSDYYTPSDIRERKLDALAFLAYENLQHTSLAKKLVKEVGANKQKYKKIWQQKSQDEDINESSPYEMLSKYFKD